VTGATGSLARQHEAYLSARVESLRGVDLWSLLNCHCHAPALATTSGKRRRSVALHFFLLAALADAGGSTASARKEPLMQTYSH